MWGRGAHGDGHIHHNLLGMKNLGRVGLHHKVRGMKRSELVQYASNIHAQSLAVELEQVGLPCYVDKCLPQVFDAHG